MARKVALVVYVDLDRIPGAFYTLESARENVEGILKETIGHYNPMVMEAPPSIQHLSNILDANGVQGIRNEAG